MLIYDDKNCLARMTNGSARGQGEFCGSGLSVALGKAFQEEISLGLGAAPRASGSGKELQVFGPQGKAADRARAHTHTHTSPP